MANPQKSSADKFIDNLVFMIIFSLFPQWLQRSLIWILGFFCFCIFMIMYRSGLIGPLLGDFGVLFMSIWKLVSFLILAPFGLAS